MTKAPRISEKQVQKDVVQLLRAIGGQVWELGHKRSKGRNCPHCKQFVPNQDFSTRQTPGLPDVEAFVPVRDNTVTMPNWRLRRLTVECKAEGGRLSRAQSDYERCCLQANLWHVVGGLDDVIAFLLEKGVIHQGQVSHYRVPQVVSG